MNVLRITALSIFTMLCLGAAAVSAQAPSETTEGTDATTVESTAPADGATHWKISVLDRI